MTVALYLIGKFESGFIGLCIAPFCIAYLSLKYLSEGSKSIRWELMGNLWMAIYMLSVIVVRWTEDDWLFVGINALALIVTLLNLFVKLSHWCFSDKSESIKTN